MHTLKTKIKLRILLRIPQQLKKTTTITVTKMTITTNMIKYYYLLKLNFYISKLGEIGD